MSDLWNNEGILFLKKLYYYLRTIQKLVLRKRWSKWEFWKKRFLINTTDLPKNVYTKELTSASSTGAQAKKMGSETKNRWRQTKNIRIIRKSCAWLANDRTGGPIPSVQSKEWQVWGLMHEWDSELATEVQCTPILIECGEVEYYRGRVWYTYVDVMERWKYSLEPKLQVPSMCVAVSTRVRWVEDKS